MRLFALVFAFAGLLATAAQAVPPRPAAKAIAKVSPTAPYTGPVIDVHLHAYPAETYAVVPMAATTTFLPPDLAQSMSPPSADAHLAATLEEMARLNIVRGYVSVDVPASVKVDEDAIGTKWLRASEGRIAVGASVGPLMHGDDPALLAAAYKRGDIAVLGELQIQYEGLGADDARFEPYFAMAEANDIPVGVHTGPGPPRSANGPTPAFRLKYGDPRLVEEVLIKHPKLRVWIMHAGWPYLGETKAMLEQYPELMADVSAIDWLIPAAEFQDYVQALIRAGFGDRLMFGSDQMLWPQGIGLALARINEASWLTTAQKQAILHDNAARFLRLDAVKTVDALSEGAK